MHHQYVLMQIRQSIGLDPQYLPTSQSTVPTAVLEDDSSRPPVSADTVPGPSIWSDTILELPIFPADSDNPVGKHVVQLGDLQQACAAAYQETAPSSEAPVPVLCDPDAVLQRHFGQLLEQPTPLIPEHSLSAEVQLPVPVSSAVEQWPLLEVPLMAAQPGGATVWARCAAELLQSYPPLSIAALPEPDLAGGATFESLIAPCQVLDEAFMLLPLVSLDQEPAATEPHLAPHAHIVDALHLKPRNMAHLQLLLDWSLADPAAPDPTGRLSRAREKLRDELEPQQNPSEHEPLPPMLVWSDLVRSLAGDPVRRDGSSHEKREELPPIMRTRLLDMQRLAEPVSNAGASGDAAIATEANEHRARQGSNPGHAAGQADENTCKGKGNAEAAVQPGYTETCPPAGIAGFSVQEIASKRARLQAPANDAAFFMGLHGAKLQAGGKADIQGQDQACSSDDSLMGR